MKVLWALICENAITNQRTNNVSLIEIIEQINVPAPAPGSVDEPDEQSTTLLNMSLVVLWARSNDDAPEKGQARVGIVAPDGRKLQFMEYEVDLMETPRSRVFGHIVGFPLLSQEGEHVFSVEKQTAESDWEKEFEIPVLVSIETDDPSE